MEAKSDKLLILDLDETLIFATEQDLGKASDFQFDRYSVFKRPHLDRFLIEIPRILESVFGVRQTTPM